MARANSAWIEIDGVKSTTLGVQVMDAHADILPARRGTQEEAAGRSGYLWLPEDADETIKIKRVLRCPRSKGNDVRLWLRKEGLVRFSGRTDAAYSARVIDGVEFRQVIGGDDPLDECTVTFLCQPHPYVYPAVADISVSTSATALTQAGTAPALPKVKVAGSGYFSVTIGLQTMFFRDVTGGGIIVDSELGDVLTFDGTLLANDKADGELFCINPTRANSVSWLTGGENDQGEQETGSVTGITITPRWRWL